MVLISALSYRWIAGSARIPLTTGAYAARCLLLVFMGFHGSVIKLQSQNSEVLRILIYTRLKINIKKIFEQVSCPEACFVSKIVQFELPRFHSAWK